MRLGAEVAPGGGGGGVGGGGVGGGKGGGKLKREVQHKRWWRVAVQEITQNLNGKHEI